VTEVETRKRHKYLSVEDSTYIFQPIAIEIKDSFAVVLLNFLTIYNHRMQTVCQDTKARMFQMQHLSVAMQHGNGTIADDDFSTEFFV